MTIHTLPHLKSIWLVSVRSSLPFMNIDVRIQLTKPKYSLFFQRDRGSFRLAGSVISGAKPRRDSRSKWFLTEEEFGGETFPDYLSGWLFFGRTSLLGRLAHNASASAPYLFIDDLLLLGVVREKVLGAKSASTFLELNSRISKDVVTVRCCLLKPKVACHLLGGPVDHDDRLMLR